MQRRLFGEPGLVMDYYDGNTVTALWNYAQHYALSDRSFSSTYGPSTPGAINLVSRQHTRRDLRRPGHRQADVQAGPYAVKSPDSRGVGTMINDPDPAFDDCSNKDHTGSNALAAMRGRNIGHLLNARNVTWGWFQGGFRPSTPWNGTAGSHAKCRTAHANVGGATVVDYSPHHNPFAYYKSTANPHHLPPKNVAEIGHAGRANHNYDLIRLLRRAQGGAAPGRQLRQGRPVPGRPRGSSDPLDEQHFLVKQINAIQSAPQWRSTAIVVAYDDSDGWYDHAYVAPKKRLHGHLARLQRQGDRQPRLPEGAEGRPAATRTAAAPGTRQPLLVISPYSKVNKVDHTLTNQASVIRFHRGQLAHRPHRRPFLRRHGRLAPTGMFDFAHPTTGRCLLNSDGS
ncbi:hypothetical protein GCM10017687_38170 [Streptomyces echinatus]|uniref:alkaline phosphatase family protein n=1 Tax=Streptomyces echinatus TaxID=67293 RepID=UPI0031EC6F31